VGSDSPVPETRLVAEAVEEARRALLPVEVDRYRALGRDAAMAMTDLCQAVRPEDSEFEAAARLAALVTATGSDPVVLLVAGESRLPVHRHPLPTQAPVGRRVMFVVCARRHGLIANVTRFVAFGGLTPAERDAYTRLLHVDAAYNVATRAGSTVGEVFRAGMEAYAAQGFDAEEWTLHHQGGPTGYEGRDYLATAASVPTVQAGQAFAWNPSAPLMKVEDTVVARAGDVPEVLTVDERWPTMTVDRLARPLILER
jgi:Xaa-Pro aminopeptidase